MLIGAVTVKAKVDKKSTGCMLRCAAASGGNAMKRKEKPATRRGPEALREAMKAREWTQVSVAEKLKVSKTTVSRWLSGQRSPARTHMAALRELLEIPIDVWV